MKLRRAHRAIKECERSIARAKRQKGMHQRAFDRLASQVPAPKLAAARSKYAGLIVACTATIDAEERKLPRLRAEVDRIKQYEADQARAGKPNKNRRK